MSDEVPGARWRHDLKNQLGIVLGFSELVLDDIEASHPARADVEEILRAARRAMSLIEEFDEKGETF